jgi:hypothetical protein
MVRVMMFQSSLTEMGITGWMLRMFWLRLFGPTFRLVLFWNGTLIRLPTGFWASLASSSALSSQHTQVRRRAVLRSTPKKAPGFARLVGDGNHQKLSR